nr:hypothetical protein Iba_scaffold10682CG0010 [Ipomoea batatas]
MHHTTDENKKLQKQVTAHSSRGCCRGGAYQRLDLRETKFLEHTQQVVDCIHNTENYLHHVPLFKLIEQFQSFNPASFLSFHKISINS